MKTRHQCTLYPLVRSVQRELTLMARHNGYHPDYQCGCWVGVCLLNRAITQWRKSNKSTRHPRRKPSNQT
jgi:hypothetical protein